MTHETIAAAFCMGTVAAMFFHGWRCYAVLCFIVAWQLFTPLRAWYTDIPLMAMCAFFTEISYRMAFLITRDRWKNERRIP